MTRIDRIAIEADIVDVSPARHVGGHDTPGTEIAPRNETPRVERRLGRPQSGLAAGTRRIAGDFRAGAPPAHPTRAGRPSSILRAWSTDQASNIEGRGPGSRRDA